jgi:hypothetical protein
MLLPEFLLLPVSNRVVPARQYPPLRAPEVELLSVLPGLIETTSKAVGPCDRPRLSCAKKKPVRMGIRNAIFIPFLMISSRLLLRLCGIEKRRLN